MRISTIVEFHIRGVAWPAAHMLATILYDMRIFNGSSKMTNSHRLGYHTTIVYSMHCRETSYSSGDRRPFGHARLSEWRGGIRCAKLPVKLTG